MKSIKERKNVKKINVQELLIKTTKLIPKRFLEEEFRLIYFLELYKFNATTFKELINQVM